MSEKKKPVVCYNPNGPGANIFVIVGLAHKALEKRDHDKYAADEMAKKVTTQAVSYDDALRIVGEYVILKKTISKK